MSVEHDCRVLAKKVIHLLKEEREARGLSKYAVAANSGLSEQTIGYFESGARRPSFETILRVAAGIGVPLEDVVARARKIAARKES